MSTDFPTWKTRERFAILGGSAVAGIGAFAFILVATLGLGLDQFRPVSQLWTVWAIAAAAITFSSQIVTVRWESQASPLGNRGLPDWVPLIGVLLLTVPILFAYRERIFGDLDLRWPLLGSLIPFGSFATGRARGLSVVHGSAARLAAVVAGENLVRVAAAVLLLLLDAGPLWYGVALLAGYGVTLMAPRRSGATPDAGASGGRDWLLPLSASTVGICCYLLLTMGPSVIALSGADGRLVSGLFVTMAFYRAPFQLLLGVVPAIVRSFSRILPVMSPTELSSFVSGSGRLISGLMLFAGFAGWLLGEPLVGGIFDTRGILDPLDHALACSLAVVGAGAMIGSIGLLSLASSVWLLVLWVTVTAVTMATGYVTSSDPTALLAVLLIGLSIIVVGIRILYLRRLRRDWKNK